MKKNNLILLLLFFLQETKAQDWRYVKGKKLYTDLYEALKNKTDVFNLQVFIRM